MSAYFFQKIAMRNVFVTLILILVSVVIFSFYSAGNESTLPPVSIPDNQLSGMDTIVLNQISVTGNSAVSDLEIRAVVSDYVNRKLSSLELFELKNQITRLYTDKGYVTSGALLLDQEVKDGEIIITIIEGELSKINIKSDGRLRERYIRKRIENQVAKPLNVLDIEKSLRRLQLDPGIRTINTELAPGLELGESVLNVNIKETDPYYLDFSINNHRSPSIGGLRAESTLAFRNMVGWGELIGGRYGLTEGLDDYSTFFSIPITNRDTSISLNYDANDSTVITKDFDELNLDSKTDVFEIAVTQPFIRSRSIELAVKLSLQTKKSETFILGQPFSFSSGVNQGKSKVTLLKIGLDWVERNQKRVNAFRSIVSLGVDWLDATTNSATPDGEFFTWLTQYQGIFKLPYLGGDNEFLIRSTIRLSSDDLLPLEKFAIGGNDTVRGYRENELTRDNGFLFSLEYRWPIGSVKLPQISKNPVDGQIQFALFSDYGYGWNVGGVSVNPRDIASIGGGLRWLPGQNFYIELYWGHALRNITGDDEHDIQDDGIHFQIGAKVF